MISAAPGWYELEDDVADKIIDAAIAAQKGEKENAELRRIIKEVAIPALSCCADGGELYAMIPESVSLAAYKDQLKVELALAALQEKVK